MSKYILIDSQNGGQKLLAKGKTEPFSPSKRYTPYAAENLNNSNRLKISTPAKKKDENKDVVEVIQILCAVPEQNSEPRTKKIQSSPRFPRISSKNQVYAVQPKTKKILQSRLSDRDKDLDKSRYIEIIEPTGLNKSTHRGKNSYLFYQGQQKYERNNQNKNNDKAYYFEPKSSSPRKNKSRLQTEPTFQIDIPFFKLDQMKRRKKHKEQNLRLAAKEVQKIQSTEETSHSKCRRKCCSNRKQVGKIRKNYLSKSKTKSRNNDKSTLSKKSKQQLSSQNPLFYKCEFQKYPLVFQTSTKIEVKKKEVQFPIIPSEKNQNIFVDQYVPLNNQISIQQLKKSRNFIIQRSTVDKLEYFYFGQIKNGKRDGKGVLIKKNMVFEGIWKNGEKISGIEKTMLGTYKGQFFNDKREGLGQFFWSHGEYYSGQWVNGKKNGNGYWNSNKGQTYMGQWRNGQVTGMGVHTERDGRKYKGQFQNFIKHGMGRQQFPNGDVYEGQYYEGAATGKGTYTWENKFTYIGEFLNGEKNGQGVLKNGKGFIFEGKFLKDLPNGPGKIIFENENTFQGRFIEGMKNGQGVYKKKKEGQTIRGYWKNDQLVRA